MMGDMLDKLLVIKFNQMSSLKNFVCVFDEFKDCVAS